MPVYKCTAFFFNICIYLRCVMLSTYYNR